MLTMSFLWDVCRVSDSYETRSNKGKRRLGSRHSHLAQQSTEADKGGDHSLSYSKSKSMKKLAKHQVMIVEYKSHIQHSTNIHDKRGWTPQIQQCCLHIVTDLRQVNN